MSGMTIIEKILAAHAGKDKVVPSEVIVTKFDKLCILDANFGMPPAFRTQPKKIYDPEVNVIIFDHMVPPQTASDADCGTRARAYRDHFGVKHFYDIGRGGIAHYVMPAEGLALPGTLIGNSDSHTAGVGAYNCGAKGLGGGTLKYAICKGDTWFKVCPTILVKFEGKLPPNTSGRDVFFKMANEIGMKTNHNFEFGGSGLKNLTMYDRQAIAIQTVELGAEFSTFPFDEVTEEFFKKVTDKPLHPVAPDPDAVYKETYVINLNEVEPQVALPPKIANNCKPARELSNLPINQATLASCAGSSLEDLKRAADILRGKHIHPGVRMIVTPGSVKIMQEADEAGYLRDLIAAGATITSPGCGACFGKHSGVLGENERVIATVTRNPRGRLGAKSSEVLLASSATVAASALKGFVTDPRDV